MTICEKNICCGCGLCKTQCPCQAIEMTPDEEGFFYPEIDDNKCVSCNRCRQICPALKSIFKEKEEKAERNRTLATYVAYKEQLTELLESSAGGVANSISKTVIETGGVVFGVRYEDDYRGACFDMAKSLDELKRFNESKYVESDRTRLFEMLPDEVASGKTVLVIGLPCDIAAVRSLVGYPDNLFTCKLICRSNTSKKALQEFLDKCEEDAGSMVKQLSLRYKEEGRTTLPTRYRIEFVNGKMRAGDFMKSDYGKAFQIFARPSCFQCAAKSEGNLADITIGDFQGLTSDNPLSKVNGVSLVCLHTDKGEKLLKDVVGLCLQKVDLEVVWKYNWMIYTSIPKSPFRDTFSRRFVDGGLRYACSQLCREQNEILDQIKDEYLTGRKPVAVWGAGDTAEYLFERLEMERWNIFSIFDGSKMKIGRKFRNQIVRDSSEIGNLSNEIEALIVMIPSENEAKLDQILRKQGWHGRTLHVGKYKFYREEYD